MSKKKEPILVPVDFSPSSELALEYATDLAEALGSKLLVLHVVHDPGDAPGYYAVKGRNNQMRRLEDTAADMLEAFMKKVREKEPNKKPLKQAKTAMVVGLPVTRILELAAKVDARMIVMGSQGRTGLAHAMLGSKAEQVVRLAPVPVMIVKQSCEQQS
ncbi:MAG: universal stress protein UspA [Gammaproteobacteria bacterium]|jgi:nucleotide-binding universal stress UspA family protein|nr:universal stress protein UspA [Gammaproteobacteria bacterium]|tara:strand:+ start:9492 stop:9968 length:477 start_codon:yes stop_codon:yes gene_type:complete